MRKEIACVVIFVSLGVISCSNGPPPSKGTAGSGPTHEVVEDRSTHEGHLIDPAVLETISTSMTIGEIVAKIGKPEQDIGSGLHVLQWRSTDGRFFVVGSQSIDPSAKPIYVKFK